MVAITTATRTTALTTTGRTTTAAVDTTINPTPGPPPATTIRTMDTKELTLVTAETKTTTDTGGATLATTDSTKTTIDLRTITTTTPDLVGPTAPTILALVLGPWMFPELCSAMPVGNILILPVVSFPKISGKKIYVGWRRVLVVDAQHA